MRNRIAAIGLGLLVSLPAMADEASVQAAITQSLKAVAPTAQIDEIVPTPVPELYEVSLGGKLLYVTGDGKFLISGQIIDLRSGENLTETKRNDTRRKAIEGVGEENMIVFSPQDPKYTVTVFTDIDCGYCRKLHREIDSYEDAGIKVRYLLFPRSGVDSPSYNKAVSVWCSEDRAKALTEAKQGKAVDKKECDNPVREDMDLGHSLGVTGTPTIVLEDGKVVPGYVPAASLKRMLDAQHM
jgi:thiol:disulfide interchange protein DsbC